MNEIFNKVRYKLGKPYNDLSFLLEALHEVLIENGEIEIAEFIPWIKDQKDSIKEITPTQLQLYSLIFQLINLVEINGAVQNRRRKESLSLAVGKTIVAHSSEYLITPGFR